MKASISIVIPAKNASAFIVATLESIQAQNVQDWECVIVNDGSEDDTVATVERAIGGDGRFRLFSQRNAGTSAARNRGWMETNAETEFVVFMDADDVWLPVALEMLRDELRKHPESPASHGLAEFIGPDGKPKDVGVFAQHGRERQGFENDRIVPWPPTRPTSFETVLWENRVYPPGVLLVRRKCIEGGLPFAPDLCLIEDWDFVQRLSRKGDIQFVDRVLLLYRRHDGNSSAADYERNRDAVRLMHCRMYYSKELDERQSVIVRKSWRAWQMFLVGEKWRHAKRELEGARVLGAGKALAQMPMQIFRYFRGYPTRTGI